MHVLFQRANPNPSIMRDSASDYKGVVCLPTFIAAALVPSGRIFLIDNRDDPMPDSALKDPYVVEYQTDLHLRTLSDGPQYRVIKVMYEPDELESLIAGEGWSVEIDATRWFIFGSARQP